jgi:hypothetical protein
METPYVWAVITLTILMLIYWQSGLRSAVMSGCEGIRHWATTGGPGSTVSDSDSDSDTDPSNPVDSAIRSAAREVGRNIRAVCDCTEDRDKEDPLAITTRALNDLWAQYGVVCQSDPREAAYGLHHALSSIEPHSLIPIVEVAYAAEPAKVKRATCALRDLPRSVRLLGVHLELA